MRQVSTTLHKVLYHSIIKPKPLSWDPGEFEQILQRWRHSVNAAQYTRLTKHVASVLADDFVNRKTGTAFPSYSTLAKAAGCHRPDAIKAIKELIAGAHLVKEPRQQTRGRSRQHNGHGEFHYIPNLMVGIRHHQLGLMVGKTGFNGSEVSDIPLQEQEVAGTYSEGPLNKKDRKQEIAPTALPSHSARVVILQIKKTNTVGIREGLRPKEASNKESPLSSSEGPSLPSCTVPPNPPISARPPLAPTALPARGPRPGSVCCGRAARGCYAPRGPSRWGRAMKLKEQMPEQLEQEGDSPEHRAEVVNRVLGEMRELGFKVHQARPLPRAVHRTAEV